MIEESVSSGRDHLVDFASFDLLYLELLLIAEGLINAYCLGIDNLS